MYLRLFIWPIVGGGLIGAWLYGFVGWWFAGLGAFIAWRSFVGFTRRYRAAFNTLLAKHTYESVSPNDQQLVMAEVKNILMSGTHPNDDPDLAIKLMSEAALFGFVALAMARLCIAPKIGDGWYSISNPYVAILGAERELAFVRYKLRQKFAIDVNVAIRQTPSEC